MLLWIELDFLQWTTAVVGSELTCVINFGLHDSSWIVTNFTTRTVSFVDYARAIEMPLSPNLNAKSQHYFRWRNVQRSLERWKEGERTWERGWEGQKITMAVFFTSAPIERYFKIRSFFLRAVSLFTFKQRRIFHRYKSNVWSMESQKELRPYIARAI